MIRKGASARARRGKLDERELLLLANYYAADSPTKGNAEQSALKAGYEPTTSRKKATEILARYDDLSFRSSTQAVGLTKPYLAMKLRQVLESGGPKEIIAAVRLVLSNMGEATDEKGAAGGMNFSGPVMIIQGMTGDRMRALKGAVPQPSAEQLEAESVARGEARLAALRSGEYQIVPKHSKARKEQDDGESVVEQSSVQAGDLIVKAGAGDGGGGEGFGGDEVAGVLGPEAEAD